MNPRKIIDEKKMRENYISPFIQSWDMIKRKSVQYKCRLLRDLENGQEPYDMNTKDPLCYFLVDDGEKDGGMFLAAAYEHFILWQNKFIDYIISNNNMNGILNSYISQLDQEIDIQDATSDEIIKIDDDIYNYFEDLKSLSSMRNIFTDDKKINYKNYNDILYNYDYIEEELGKLLLPGLKKFKNDKIKFITYLYEGFRGGNSKVLVDYNNKYIQRELSEEEKKSLNELIQTNNSSQFYNDIFASLQILMNEIIKENYNQNQLIYGIIKSLPNYIILNDSLKNLLKERNEYLGDEKSFTINSLVSIFEYFEALCWKDMKNNILLDYNLDLSEKTKNYILDYFEKIQNEEKVINKKNFTTALRRLISRFITGSREEIDIKSDAALKLYIGREEYWSKEVFDNDSFDMEIDEICIDDIKIGNCYKLYNLLRGDSFLEREIYKNDGGENEDEIGKNQINNYYDNEINLNEINELENKDEQKGENEDDDDDPEDNEESREEF
jgi:hypothetical protein